MTRARPTSPRRAAAFILLLAGGLTAVLPGNRAGAHPGSAGATTLDDRPNIVIVLTDDQRVLSIGAERMPQVWSTIALKGRDYPNASVPTSLCCPSRASILTGLFAHRTRVYSNSALNGGWQTFHAMGLEHHTIAVALHRAGYHTGLVGKYLNGGFPAALARGFRPSGWDSIISFTTSPEYYNYSLNDGRTYGQKPADYSTDVLAGHAVSFIREAPAAQPLFLYFATVGPHRPFTPAPRDVGAWAGRLPWYDPASARENLSDKPPWVRSVPRMGPAHINHDLELQQEALMSVDDAVGGITAALRDTGRLHNTLIIYLSDNGLMLGEHHMAEWKNLPYRWSTSVPLLLRWDGHIAPGSVDPRLALNVDLAATISKAADVEMSTEGLDLLGPTQRSGFPLEGGKFFESDSPPRHPAYCGYRTQRWMFTQYATGQRELYDYGTDPEELTNLADRPAYAAIQRALRLKAEQTCRPVPPDFSWTPVSRR